MRRRSRSRKKLPIGCIILLAIAALPVWLISIIHKVPPTPPSSDIRVKEVGSYRIGKTSRSVLLIPRNLNREELIDLARDIHIRNPKGGGFDLFDDDSQMTAYLEHKNNLLDAYINPQKMKFAYPEQFVQTHRVAIIQMVDCKTDGRFKWRLTNGMVDSLVVDDSRNIIVDLE
jgi:hypothetical protein